MMGAIIGLLLFAFGVGFIAGYIIEKEGGDYDES